MGLETKVDMWSTDLLFGSLPTFIYIYAEAVNKVSGPTQEIYDLVNSVRERSFMAPMPPAVLTDANLMQEYIQRERRVELFYENWRYWQHAYIWNQMILLS